MENARSHDVYAFEEKIFIHILERIEPRNLLIEVFERTKKKEKFFY